MSPNSRSGRRRSAYLQRWGATAGDVLKMILRSGLVMAAVGLALGFAGTLALTRLLEDILFGVGSRDPLTIAAVAGILAGVTMLGE